jgi:hypothetical protein
MNDDLFAPKTIERVNELDDSLRASCCRLLCARARQQFTLPLVSSVVTLELTSPQPRAMSAVWSKVRHTARACTQHFKMIVDLLQVAMDSDSVENPHHPFTLHSFHLSRPGT